MWPKFRSSPTGTGGSSSRGEASSLRNKLNVNEEYMEAFRTKSYLDIWSKIQEGQLIRRTSTSSEEETLTLSSLSSLSPFPSYRNLCNLLLEPPQEIIIDLIETTCSEFGRKIRRLLVDYFECSLEAFKICGFLLQNIDQTRIDHCKIQRVIYLNSCSSSEDQCGLIFGELASFAKLPNPLPCSSLVKFHLIHNRYELILHQLTLKREKIKRRVKLIRLSKKAAGIGLIITCSALAVATLILAVHTIVGIAASPAGITFSLGLLKRKMKSIKMGINTSVLCRVEAQLDAAAKGVYILNRDFDTVNRQVIRLQDEIDHEMDIANMCVRNQNREMLMEVVREFKMNESGFLEQLGELEEHVYLCFLTINRARRLVLQEIMVPPSTELGIPTREK